MKDNIEITINGTISARFDGIILINNKPIVELLESHVPDWYGLDCKFVDVKYSISDEKTSFENVESSYVMQAMGQLDCIEYMGTCVYWTCEVMQQDFCIGSHDLKKELSKHNGKYLNLILKVVD